MTFESPGSGYAWTVPEGVESIDVRLVGGHGGGANFGYGAVVDATLPVTPGQELYVWVGGNANGWQAGWNGGGQVGWNTRAGAGGGSSDIRGLKGVASETLPSRFVVAGGGGGAGGPGNSAARSGGAGGNAGESGTSGATTHGGGLGGAGLLTGAGSGGTGSSSACADSPTSKTDGLPGDDGTADNGGSGGAPGNCYYSSNGSKCFSGTASGGGGGGGGYWGGGGGGGGAAVSSCSFSGPSAFYGYGGGGGGGGASYAAPDASSVVIASAATLGAPDSTKPRVAISWRDVTATSITCSPSVVEVGSEVSCEVRVSGGSEAPGGTAVVEHAGAQHACLLAPDGISGSSCAVSIELPTPGEATVTAAYPGDATHQSSSGSTPVTVNTPPPAAASPSGPTAPPAAPSLTAIGPTAPAPSVAPTPASPAASCVVPRLLHLRLASARRVALRRGCALRIRRVRQGRRHRVLRQSPPPGRVVPAHTRVRIFVRR